MANTKSEQVLSSAILKKWQREGTVKLVRRGQYRFVRRPELSAVKWQDLLELFKAAPEGDKSA